MKLFYYWTVHVVTWPYNYGQWWIAGVHYRNSIRLGLERERRKFSKRGGE